MTDGFSVQVVGSGFELVVAAEGELDALTAPQLREALSAVAGNVPVVIDLQGITFIDSSGLSVLVGAAKRYAEAGCHLLVRGARPSVYRVLEMTHLVDVLPVEAPEPRQ